jgi:hypothetical protein
MKLLLNIQSLVLTPKITHGNEIRNLMAETIWITWIRNHKANESLWKDLEVQMRRVNHFPEVAKHWSHLLIQLTLLMAQELYGINSEIYRPKRNKQKQKDSGSETLSGPFSGRISKDQESRSSNSRSLAKKESESTSTSSVIMTIEKPDEM